MKEVLSKNEIKYAYIDVCESVGALKKFLTLRDTADVYKDIRENSHRAGIPCIVIDDDVILVDGPEQMQELIEQYHLKEN